MSLTYSKANEHDAAEVATLHNRCVRRDYEGHIPDQFIKIPVTEKRIEAWRGWINRSRVNTVVARANDEMIGFTTYHPNNDDAADENSVELVGIYVSEPYWGQGIGYTLFTHTLKDSREQNFSGIVVWEIETNLVARDFYESLGFNTDKNTRIFLEQTAGPIREIKYQLPAPTR